MPFCGKCGEPIVGDSLFCVKCGKPVLSKKTPKSEKKTLADSPKDRQEEQDYEQLPDGYVLENRYVKVKQLDKGYYKAAYRVLDKKNEQLKVIRFLPDNVLSDKRLLFELRQEAQIMMPLNHRNILKVLEFHQSDRYTFITVENYTGKTLREVLSSQGSGKMTELEISGWLEQIIDGMSHAHEKGVLHKGLNLDNIYITEEGSIKISDFGIARTMQLSLSRLKGDNYSKVYESPEQLRGEIVDRSVDVYSLGILLYELLDGSLPFSDKDGNVFRQIMTVKPQPLPDVSESLNKFMLKCLEKDREKRYQDFVQLRQDREKQKQLQEEGTDIEEEEEGPESLSYRPRAGRLTFRFIMSKVIKLVVLLIIVFAVAFGVNWLLEFRQDFIETNLSLAAEMMETEEYEAAKEYYRKVLLINRSNTAAQEGLIKAIDIIGQMKINNPDMIYVRGGTFTMGCEDGEEDERPVHRVTLSDYYISKTLVTQKEWTSVMDSNPSKFRWDNLPVENVSWYHALVFLNKLSIKEDLTPVYIINRSRNPEDWGNVPITSNADWDAVRTDWSADGYRLPTEAEWEYAARGGNKSKGFIYAGSDDIDEVAWYLDNSRRRTIYVGIKKPNELGLYDMSGNVWEWCWDIYGEYTSSDKTNPLGAKAGNQSVLRGGSWDSGSDSCRVTNRRREYPGNRYGNIGFRYVRRLE